MPNTICLVDDGNALEERGQGEVTITVHGAGYHVDRSGLRAAQTVKR